MIRRIATALLVTLLVASPALAGKWESPALASGAFRPSKIAVLPATSEMVLARLAEALPFIKETKLMEDALRRESGAALTALGYAPDLESLSPERIASDRELQAMVRELEEHVSTIVDVAAGKPKDIGKGRFSIGEHVLPLAERTGAEGFLWLQSQSVVPSKGQRTLASIFSVLSGSYGVPTNQTQLLAVLIDARTGDLASVTVAASGGPVLKEPEKVAKSVVKDVFSQWPAFGEARKVSEKRLAAAETASKPHVALPGQDVDELALIERFEIADAKLSGRPTAGPSEEVLPHAEFTQEGQPIAAKDAAAAAIGALFEPPPAEPAAAPAPLPTPAAPAATPVTPPPARPAPAPVVASAPVTAPVVASTPPPASAPAGPRVPSARETWDVPAGSRPVPTRQVVLQMVDGAPSVTVRNTTRETVLVSVDVGEWVRLAPGEQSRFETGAGSHRVIAASPEGVELARASVVVSSRQANAEIWPF